MLQEVAVRVSVPAASFTERISRHMGTRTFRHSYRMWIDSIGTPVGAKQKLMRDSEARLAMNIYGDAAAEEIRQVNVKVAQKLLNGR